MINIGVFLPNWIGDVVMATPTLRGLRAHYGPEAKLVGILRPYVADVLAGTNWLDDLLFYDRRAPDMQLKGRSFIRRLRQRQLDTVLLLTNSLRSAFFAWASGAPQRVGYVRYGRGPLLTERLYPPRHRNQFAPVSAVDYYLQLAEVVGATWESRQLELATLPVHERQADGVWRKYGLPTNGPVVVLSTGAAHGNAKRWPAENFALLARRIALELAAPVLIICGPDERQSANAIERMSGTDRVISLGDEQLSVGLSKAIVRRSQLLITNDSGPRHFAAAFRVPSIVLFGPTDPRWSENYHIQELHVRKNVPCGPCGRRQCPLAHHRCMWDLTVEQVFDAAVDKLRTRPDYVAA